MSYIRQKDAYNCGPVAIINALKWLGYKAGHDDTKRVSDSCNTTTSGTNSALLTFGLFKEVADIASITKAKPSISQLDKHLASGGVAVIGYHFTIGKKSAGHYVLCTKKSKKDYYTLINEASHRSFKEGRPTAVRRTRDDIKKMLRTKNAAGDANLWLLERRK